MVVVALYLNSGPCTCYAGALPLSRLAAIFAFVIVQRVSVVFAGVASDADPPT
jgi:hypothetical protein